MDQTRAIFRGDICCQDDKVRVRDVYIIERADSWKETTAAYPLEFRYNVAPGVEMTMGGANIDKILRKVSNDIAQIDSVAYTW